MRRRLALLVISSLIAVALPAPASAAAPANDEPAGATPLQIGVAVEFDSSDATANPAVDPSSCNGSNGFFDGPFYASVWFSYTATAADNILYVDAPTIQGHPDDFLAITFVFEVTGSGLEELDCRAYGNDASWKASPGATYLIMEAGLDADVTGEPELSDRGGHGHVTLISVKGRTLSLTFEFEDTFSLGCADVNLVETATISDRYTITFAADGSMIRFTDVVHWAGVITNVDTGATYRDPAHFYQRIDVRSGTFSQAGLIYGITIPGEGMVALDAGLITWYPDGTVVVRGPHEVFDGLDLCEALS